MFFDCGPAFAYVCKQLKVVGEIKHGWLAKASKYGCTVAQGFRRSVLHPYFEDRNGKIGICFVPVPRVYSFEHRLLDYKLSDIFSAP
jgi:hypothetical protein